MCLIQPQTSCIVLTFGVNSLKKLKVITLNYDNDLCQFFSFLLCNWSFAEHHCHHGLQKNTLSLKTQQTPAKAQHLMKKNKQETWTENCSKINKKKKGKSPANSCTVMKTVRRKQTPHLLRMVMEALQQQITKTIACKNLRISLLISVYKIIETEARLLLERRLEIAQLKSAIRIYSNVRKCKH